MPKAGALKAVPGGRARKLKSPPLASAGVAAAGASSFPPAADTGPLLAPFVGSSSCWRASSSSSLSGGSGKAAAAAAALFASSASSTCASCVHVRHGVAVLQLGPDAFHQATCHMTIDAMVRHDIRQAEMNVALDLAVAPRLKTPPLVWACFAARQRRERTAGECRVLSGEDGGDPGGKPKRKCRTGLLGGGASVTARTTSAAANSAGERATPKSNLRAVPSLACAGPASCSCATEGVLASAAAEALLDGGNPKLKVGAAADEAPPVEQQTHDVSV